MKPKFTPRRLVAGNVFLALILTAAFGLMGSGAAFTDHYGGTGQTFTIGSMTLTVNAVCVNSSGNVPGVVVDSTAKTITLPAINVNTSATPPIPMLGGANIVFCKVTATSSGGIVPSSITLKASVENDSPAGLELNKFTLMQAGATPTTIALLSAVKTNPITLTPANMGGAGVGVQWSGLTNPSMGGTFNLVISVDAVQ